MSQFPQRLDAVILAGGPAKRMGGQNKALIEHNGQPLFRYALENIQPYADKIIVSANRDGQVFKDQGFVVVADGPHTDLGPLAGIAAALDHSDADGLIVAACDQLTLPEFIYPTLIEKLSETCGVVASNDGDLLPTCAVLPASTHAVLDECLSNRQLRLSHFMNKTCRVHEFARFEFANINSIEQIEQ